jgi:hypothetical protein
LVKAYQSSGFNPNVIRTGVAEFEKTTDRGNAISTLSESSKEMDRKEEEMVREQNKGDEKKIASRLEQIRASREESRRRVVQERMKILISGNDNTYGGEPGEKYKRRYERHEYVPSLAQWIHTNIDLMFGTLMLRSSASELKLYISWIPNNRDLVIRDQNVSFGEFQEFGRFREDSDSHVARITFPKLDRKTFALPADFQKFAESEIQSLGLSINITGEIDYDDSAKAKVIEVKKGDKLFEKYHIDVERGYLCPYQYVATESGDYFIERTAKEYVVEKNTGLYYPTSYREVISRSNGADKTDTHYRLVPDTLRLNHPVSDKEFAIDIPEDARVADFRDLDNQVRYVAIKKGTVSLAKGGYDFDKMDWLAKEISIENFVPPTGGASGWTRWPLMGIGVVFILIALLNAFYKRWKRS